MIGSPGAGKTKPANCMPSIWPPRSMQKALETNTTIKRPGPSAWAGDRIRQGARPIADSAGTKQSKIQHLAEASLYRKPDREG